MAFMLAAVTCLGMWQCSKDDDTVTEFSLSTTTWNDVTVAGGTQSITLDAPADWTVLINYNEGSGWLSLDHLFGSRGRYTLQLTAERNTSYDSRTATVTVLCGQESKTLSVKQDGREGFQIAPAEQLRELQSGDTTITVTVNSNITYHYSIPQTATWVKAVTGKGLTPSTISFHIDANTGAESRSAIITFYAASGEDVDMLIRQAALKAE